MRIISVNPGSHTFRLLQLLSVVGEFPVSSLSLLGSVRTLTALIRKLESRHLIRLEDGRIIGPYRLLNISGRIPNRTIRMYSDAISVMDAILPGASAYYLDAFFGHRFPGNVQHIIRNHRVAEATACFQRAGIEFRPYVLPQLQNTEILPVVPDWPRFYPSRAIKRLTGDEFNKTM